MSLFWKKFAQKQTFEAVTVTLLFHFAPLSFVLTFYKVVVYVPWGSCRRRTLTKVFFLFQKFLREEVSMIGYFPSNKKQRVYLLLITPL